MSQKQNGKNNGEKKEINFNQCSCIGKTSDVKCLSPVFQELWLKQRKNWGQRQEVCVISRHGQTVVWFIIFLSYDHTKSSCFEEIAAVPGTISSSFMDYLYIRSMILE